MKPKICVWDSSGRGWGKVKSNVIGRRLERRHPQKKARFRFGIAAFLNSLPQPLGPHCTENLIKNNLPKKFYIFFRGYFVFQSSHLFVNIKLILQVENFLSETIYNVRDLNAHCHQNISCIFNFCFYQNICVY